MLQATLLPMTLTSVILFLLLQVGDDKVYKGEFLLPLGWVKAEVFPVCQSLAEARVDTLQDDINQVVVSHLGMDIKSTDIV